MLLRATTCETSRSRRASGAIVALLSAVLGYDHPVTTSDSSKSGTWIRTRKPDRVKLQSARQDDTSKFPLIGKKSRLEA